ncbi:MAG: hypothetical protein J7M21_05965, partial [Planctomycetes bacterium]|nr:hypothetical protein [Planctomycetota bacterium]
ACLFRSGRLRLRLPASACIDDATYIACFGLLVSLVLARPEIGTFNLKVLWPVVTAGQGRQVVLAGGGDDDESDADGNRTVR